MRQFGSCGWVTRMGYFFSLVQQCHAQVGQSDPGSKRMWSSVDSVKGMQSEVHLLSERVCGKRVHEDVTWREWVSNKWVSATRGMGDTGKYCNQLSSEYWCYFTDAARYLILLRSIQYSWDIRLVSFWCVVSDVIRWRNFCEIEADSWLDEGSGEREHVDGLQRHALKGLFSGKFEL